MATSGWANIGSALAGNPARQAALYDQGATGVARLEGLLSEARRRRDEEAGYAGITPEAISSAQSDPSQAASLVSAMFHANVDPQRLSGYQRENLGTTIQQDAYDRVRGGAAVADVNPLLAVMQGKPVEVSNVKDGVSFNPYATPDNNRFDPTQVGLAEIMQKGAQAEAEHAAASNSYASAARTRAGIGLDKAANYEIVQGEDGSLVRVPKMGGAAVPVTFGDGSPVKKAGGYGSAPTGYRFDMDGNLKVIPGGPADKKAGVPTLPPEARAKLGMLDAASDALDKYEAAAFTTGADGSRSFNSSTAVLGPAQAFLNDAINGTLRYESGAGVPDYELAAARSRYAPSTFAREGTNEAKIKLLRDKIKTQRETLVNGPRGSGGGQGADPSHAGSASPGGTRGNQHAVGDVLTVGGKQYRVVGGDPTDPDLEPL